MTTEISKLVESTEGRRLGPWLTTLKAAHLNTHITLVLEQEIIFSSIKILKLGDLFITTASIMLTNTGITTGLELT